MPSRISQTASALRLPPCAAERGLPQGANQRMAAELERAHEQAVQAAFTDELTNVPNRRHILKLAVSALTDPRKHSQPVSFALLDLDHFKKINDTYVSGPG